MHPIVVYSLSRLALFAVSLGVLYLIGARDLLLLVLAIFVSGLASYVLLSGQRDRVALRITKPGHRTAKERVTPAEPGDGSKTSG
ncbi:DUF4229 domain-containing protein [Rhizohabitans arisaemae]|uniref:DUF4229 domain-containing protein n=1 Tax=Rhizohabitans arisaemae TaxID=2720610 RepID=UPI0024B14FC2|nr:DUF4229 domain-containing protein [Rhizohabitans arisaemae]